MSRFHRSYGASDRVTLEVTSQRARDLEDLQRQVDTLTKERDALAKDAAHWSGLALAYRYQLKHPGTSLDDAIKATRGRPIPEEKPGD
jgi:hypothetical protein